MCSLDGSTICQLDGFDDSVLDEIDEEEEILTDAPPDDNTIVSEREKNKQKNTHICILNTNARSLCPKIESWLDCFEEMDGTIGIITETWLSDGDTLDRDIRDCLLYTSDAADE